MTVYFIERAGNIKIGFTGNLKSRLAALGNSHPAKLTLLGSIPGTRYAEKEFHTRLAGFSVGGEWFRDCKEVRGAIAKAILHADFAARNPVADFLRELEATTKVKPPSTTFFKNLTPEQLGLLSKVLLGRQKNAKIYKASEAIGGEVAAEVRAILSLTNDQFKALIADCLYPTKGEDDELTARMREHIAVAEFNRARAKSLVAAETNIES